jgi:MFS family permease
VLLTALAGLTCAVLTVVVELRVENPMLDLRLFGNRMFRLCNIVGFFSIASFLGVTFVMPLYLQLIRGMDPFQSGLTTFPQAIGVMASSFIAGSLYARIGPRRLMAGGFFSAGLTIVLFTALTADTNLWLVRGLMLLRGFCMGFAFVPMQAASYATIDPSQNGRASSLFSTQRQVGVSFGVAIMASVLAAHMSLSQPVAPDGLASALDGVHMAFAIAVGFAFLAAVFALFIRDEDARATMAARRR